MINYVDEELFQQIVNWRRDFHSYPEQGWTEYVTSYKIYELLKGLGYETHLGDNVCKKEARFSVPESDGLSCEEQRAFDWGVPEDILSQMRQGQTGVVGLLKSDRGKYVLALRFDIDALPMEEKTGLSFSSKRAGLMHACGHDGHIAGGLGLAVLLSKHRELWEETYKEIRLIFQPAEEGTRGALSVVANGWLDEVDLFLSGHIGMGLKPVGQVRLCTDGFYATAKMNLTFTGKASHAGKAPEQGKNALVAASTFVTNVYGIPRHSAGMSRVNVGLLQSGSFRNIVPDYAYLELESRGATDEINDYMCQRVEQLAAGAAMMQDVSYELIQAAKVSHAVSDSELLIPFAKIMNRTNDLEGYFEASEDATEMMLHVQKQGGKAGFFIFGSDLSADHHMCAFDYEEEVLQVMVNTYLNMIIATDL